MTTETRIVKPGEMEAPLSEIRFLFLPGGDLFAHRAERLRSLAEDHSMGKYLAFLALLADAQQATLGEFPSAPLPEPGERALCRERGMPLLGARSLTRDPAWRAGLTMILQRLGEADLPPAAREAVAGLLNAGATELEEMADRVLAGDIFAVPPRDLPFVAAALQVYWVSMASAMEERDFQRLEERGRCPVCGSYPNAGIVRSGGAEHGLRYLSCSLCASQWHVVRITCSSCQSTKGIDYFTLQGSNGAVKAEWCSGCGTYLKLLYLEKDGRMEAMADDLATLGLDMLMDAEGRARGGPNLFFHPGT